MYIKAEEWDYDLEDFAEEVVPYLTKALHNAGMTASEIEKLQREDEHVYKLFLALSKTPIDFPPTWEVYRTTESGVVVSVEANQCA